MAREIRVPLRIGEIVQLSPECRAPEYAHCLMIVVEPRESGAAGIIWMPGINGGSSWEWSEMERTGGMAAWLSDVYLCLL